MTDRPCPGHRCDAALPPGAVICPGCVARTRGRLRAAPELLRELDVTITRQSVGGDGGSADGGIVFDPVASEAAVALVLCLHGWVRVLLDETTIQPEHRRIVDRLLSSPAGQSHLLRADGRLGARVWAAECAEEIRVATSRGWAAVDLPPEQLFVGWCPDTCGVALYAPVGALRVRCRACGSTWDVQASRDALLAAAVDVHATAVDVGRALQLDPALIRSWRHRGRIIPTGVNTAGQPLYRVSDVQALKSHPMIPGGSP